ncbi:VOC family protein [Palleronia sp. LCG004]|uniref:VOC family protein n=1 Tax=Palleronia sp. LCG004 TaxID=3079304 RepID=UPI0029420655|nr:VOC family protein [Palleronia sp. LCG004]WOI55458.1 VOC family protein [Palleronia sp. LCG004]
MRNAVSGLHHVTALSSDARNTEAFLAETLGLRRVKKTVNFDAPEIYHLYYGDEIGRPGTVITYFPFPDAARGRPGTGEVSTTALSIPEGSAEDWIERLEARGVAVERGENGFGETRLQVAGPDGADLALVEDPGDTRAPWTEGGIPERMAIRGLHSVTLRLRDSDATIALLRFMGYEQIEVCDEVTRLAITDGTAGIVDVEVAEDMPPASQGAGSVHHVAFSVATRARQLEMRAELVSAGYDVTPPIDRDYFWAIYFRSPGGVLFEIATDEPGFERDEDRETLGRALKLPAQHEYLRERLERELVDLG